MRPAKAFYPARDHLLSSGLRPFFNDRYAATNRRNDSHLMAKTLFVVFATDSSEKRPEFLFLSFGLQRRFSFGPLEWWRPAGTLSALNVAHWFKRLPTPDLNEPEENARLRKFLWIEEKIFIGQFCQYTP